MKNSTDSLKKSYPVYSGTMPHFVGKPFLPFHAGARWFGSLVEELKLPERPDVASVARLLNLQHIPALEAGPEKSIAAVRLTFSAPKCVTIAALVCQDRRVVLAHEKAIQSCLHAALLIRAGRSHERDSLFGVFHRYATVDGYPNLHTHLICFAANEAEHQRMRGFNAFHLVRQLHELNEVYHTSLAASLVELGYAVRVVEGVASISDVPHLMRRIYSRQSATMQHSRRPAVDHHHEPQATHQGEPAIHGAKTKKRDEPAPSYEEVLQAWHSEELMQEHPYARAWLSKFVPPRFNISHVLHGAYTRLRAPRGGVAYGKLLLETFADLGGHCHADEVLHVMNRELAAGTLILEGSPPVVYNEADIRELRYAQLPANALRASRAGDFEVRPLGRTASVRSAAADVSAPSVPASSRDAAPATPSAIHAAHTSGSHAINADAIRVQPRVEEAPEEGRAKPRLAAALLSRFVPRMST